MNSAVGAPALLEVEDLTIAFHTDRGIVRAVNGISFGLGAGQTLGLVGESGCGKSVTASALLRLLPAPLAQLSGRVRFQGRDVLAMQGNDLLSVRGKGIGLIFQDPQSALNPVFGIGSQMTETIRAHGGDRSSARAQAMDALRDVGLPDPDAILSMYPHQLSGGMRQRVLIAMALTLHPKLLIADEPTTALDLTVQAQIIELLQRLKAKHDLSLLLISHDLGVVAQLADRMAVMYAGKIVESGPLRSVFESPRHPYTRGLIDAIPSVSRKGPLSAGIPGTVPDAARLPGGCAFHPRCARVVDPCRTTSPEITMEADRIFECHNPQKENEEFGDSH
jgi:oligopeptide/dipeptide ABC transporter ATP-binding protein